MLLVPVLSSGFLFHILRAESSWIPLFNGRTLGGWYTFLPSTGTNSDPKGVFKVHDGMIHILDIAITGERQEFGYVATEKAYSNYRLRFEYKWGDKRFSPRAEAKRDSGLLYHFVGPDRVWPRSVECQVQETDTGDFWLVGGASLTTTVESAEIGIDCSSAAAGSPICSILTRYRRAEIDAVLAGAGCVRRCAPILGGSFALGASQN